MKNNTLSEFRPAIRFVAIFVGVYLIGNILYGLFVEYYHPRPDPATVLVASEVDGLINLLGHRVESKIVDGEPIVLLKRVNANSGISTTVLRIFEGCNGLNVCIVFVAFIVAFGGTSKKMTAFIVTGFIIIHVFNLLRIILLYYTALNRPHFFYYFHKYFFTAVLYFVIFVLWIVWTRMKPRNSGALQA